MSLCWVFYSLSRSLLTPVPHSTPTPCPAASPALVLPCWTLCHQKAGCLFLMWSRRARTALRLVFTLKMLFYSQNLGIKSDCAVGKRVQWISNVSVKLKSPASPETGISSTSDLNFFYQIWLKSCHSHGLSCGEANSRKTHARWEVDSFRSFCIFKKQMRVPKDGVNMCVMMQQWKKTAALLQGVKKLFCLYSGSGNLFIAANFNELWRVKSSSVAQLQHLANMDALLDLTEHQPDLK